MPNFKSSVIYYAIHIHIPGNIIYDAKMNDEIDLLQRAKDRELAAKTRTHVDDTLSGKWPTTVEQCTTADSVFNFMSM